MNIALSAILAAALTAVLTVSSPLQAQTAQSSPATRLNGVIERIDGATCFA